MITARAFAGKSYCVLGLARSGMAAVEALLASGAQVTAWDRRLQPREALAGRARIADPLEIDLTPFDGIVVSPGVPLNTHPLAQRAHEAGVPVIGDIELFALARPELAPHKVVGITGTNGKSTTTALVHHILTHAGIPARMGGNIGLPILAQEPLPEGGVYVLELSSYQIDLTYSLDCDVALLLNITPDHLDRYDGFDAYAASKVRLIRMQSEEGRAAFLPLSAAHIPAVDGLHDLDQFHSWIGPPYLESQADWPTLQGPHNLENVQFARNACGELGLTHVQIEHGLRTYPGLPHRMERIGPYRDILFVNDSKATNPASTAPALAAYSRIHWICGGLPKDDSLAECEPHLGNVVRAYTIGEAAPLFAQLLEGKVPAENCELLSEAVQRALDHAGPGDVIMLSPACASFDQYRDFEHRGETFRQLVRELTREEG